MKMSNVALASNSNKISWFFLFQEMFILMVLIFVFVNDNLAVNPRNFNL